MIEFWESQVRMAQRNSSILKMTSKSLLSTRFLSLMKFLERNGLLSITSSSVDQKLMIPLKSCNVFTRITNPSISSFLTQLAQTLTSCLWTKILKNSTASLTVLLSCLGALLRSLEMALWKLRTSVNKLSRTCYILYSQVETQFFTIYVPPQTIFMLC